MSGQEKRTPEQIQADLARTREELARSVDELSTRLDPRVQLQETKANLKAALDRAAESGRQAARSAQVKTQALLDDAKDGDPKAIGIIGGAAAGVALLVALAARRNR